MEVTIDKIPSGSDWLVDGMAMLQQLHSRKAPMTFFLLAEYILLQLVKLAQHHHSITVHFVTDTYPDISIKNAQRIHRAATGVQVVKIQATNTNQKRPTLWKQFLSAGKNKEELVRYLFSAWTKTPASTFRNVTVYIAHGRECHAIGPVNGTVQVTIIPELECSHEEADTRLLLHAAYVHSKMSEVTCATPSDPPAIVIKSPDTDVLVISLGFAQDISSRLLFHTGRGDTVRTIDVKLIQKHLGTEVCGSFRVKSSHHLGSISWIFFKFAESFWSYEKTLKPKFEHSGSCGW